MAKSKNSLEDSLLNRAASAAQMCESANRRPRKSAVIYPDSATA